MNYLSNKYHWKVEWCEEQQIPPAETWAWTQAEEAWEKCFSVAENIRAKLIKARGILTYQELADKITRHNERINYRFFYLEENCSGMEITDLKNDCLLPEFSAKLLEEFENGEEIPVGVLTAVGTVCNKDYHYWFSTEEGKEKQVEGSKMKTMFNLKPENLVVLEDWTLKEKTTDGNVKWPTHSEEKYDSLHYYILVMWEKDPFFDVHLLKGYDVSRKCYIHVTSKGAALNVEWLIRLESEDGSSLEKSFDNLQDMNEAWDNFHHIYRHYAKEEQPSRKVIGILGEEDGA